MDGLIAFHQELYEEHLEEASFLYECRAKFIHDDELSWTDLHDYEQRFEAHLQGLAGGGDHALDICTQAALGDQPGDVYVAMRLLCLNHDVRKMVTLLEQASLEDADVFQALVDGLCHGCPDSWFPELISHAEKQNGPVSAVVLRVLAWRQASQAESFIFNRWGQPELLNHLSWGLCRVPVGKLNYDVGQRLLNGEAWEFQSEAAFGVLQTGDKALLSALSADMRWARVALGLAGSRAHALALLKATPVTTMSILALGLLGEVLAVEPLLRFLNDPRGASQTALALQLITGADLWEEVFIAEEVEEEDLLEHELPDFRAGEQVKNPNGNPAGEYVVRLCQSEDRWRRWWAQNQASFQTGIRYRYGKPFTPNSLVESLKRERSPNKIRYLAHLEFQIRYGFKVPFELEMPIPQQRQALEAYARWTESNQTRFRPGAWYFAETLQTS